MQQACAKVQNFSIIIEKFRSRLSIAGKSESTFKNYAMHIAKISLHYNCVPTELDEDQINDYLYLMQRQHNTPSLTAFKFCVYGLRLLFKIEGLDEKRIQLPSIKQKSKLPIVLSVEEVKRLLVAPKLLKHRLLLSLLYGCGLRCGEVRAIELKHIDYDRKTLLIPPIKGHTERYLPLNDMLIRGIKKYVEATSAKTYLFTNNSAMQEGLDFDSRYSQRGVQWAVKEACKRAGIHKDVSVHTLRHTYATHLLENGLNILAIQKLLGHASIDTTMVYLHLVNSHKSSPYSPLDTLYPEKKNG